jgi:hypothetical protein
LECCVLWYLKKVNLGIENVPSPRILSTICFDNIFLWVALCRLGFYLFVNLSIAIELIKVGTWISVFRSMLGVLKRCSAVAFSLALEQMLYISWNS